ncbi:MAG: DNA/RNA non-specific endonuclease [Muribaculaceae bacterium]|nr:DNA/RNA non-specific endonuclease [Muribaculaceae bacterium]
MLKRIYLFSMLACLALGAMAATETRSVTFDFSSPEALTQLGLPTPTSSNPTYLENNITVGDITFIPGSSSPRSTFYQNQYTFYTTSGNTFSFQAASGATIKRVDFYGFYTKQRFTASPAGFDSENSYWSGSASQVTFTGTGGNTLYSMTVTYEMEVPDYDPCDVNHDGSVTASDITALYNYLLSGDETYLASSDVNGDGDITSADITMIYNYLLTGDEPPAPTVPAPTFSHPSGTVFEGDHDIIITGPQGSKIYFTIDGSNPSTTNYWDNGLSPFTLSLGVGTITIKAIAVLNGKSSAVATATYTVEQVVDNNINANWKETSYNIPQSGATPTSSSATYNQAWRIEYPHITPNSNYIVVVKATSEYGVSLSLELDKSQRANHWTCFTMHAGTPNNNVGRTPSFSVDDDVPTAYQVNTNEYTSGKYTTSVTNLDGNNMTMFARGHICASEDRQSSSEQNSHTFVTSNIHPQYQAHNAGLWQRMEGKVQNWGYSNSFRDTLYVCKGATIGNVTLNGSTTSGLIPKSEVQSLYGVNITGTLPIPRYWYMAVLRLKNGQYEAMAYWTEQINSSCSSTTLQSCMITIDELEQRTGIDFFCNLPDDIEEVVEASLNTSIWQ